MNVYIDMKGVTTLIFKQNSTWISGVSDNLDVTMVWDHPIRWVLGVCVSNLERNGSVGNRALLGGISNQMKMWVVFGRFSVLSPKNSISRASAEIKTGPSQGGASGYIAPTTNLAASTRNVQNIKDWNSDQPAKGHCWKQRKQVNLRNRFLAIQNKEARHMYHEDRTISGSGLPSCTALSVHIASLTVWITVDVCGL